MDNWIAVRGRAQNKLLFRYHPEFDLIEICVRGQIEVVCLEDYRLPDQRPAPAPKVAQKMGIDKTEQPC